MPAKKSKKTLGDYISIMYVVIIVILVLFLAKLLFVDRGNIFIYVYGLLVTLVLLITFVVAFRFYSDPYIEAKKYLKKKNKIPSLFVSSLVAVHNEEDVIVQCVDSFLGQTYKNQEIIIIDDASTDNTRKVLVDKYSKNKNVKIIKLDKNVGKKRALAEGMLVAKGEVFAFSDSDSVLAPDAIERIVTIFQANPDVGGVSGHCRALNGKKNLITKIQDSWYEGQFSVRKAFESVFSAVSCVSGPLAVFRRSAIYNYIPAWQHDSFFGQEFRFATDRTLTGFVLGSNELDKRLKKKYAGSPFLKKAYPPQSWRIIYCKSARALTNVPETFRAVIKQQVRWKKSFIRNMFFTGEFYWKKHPIVATNYYLHILFVWAGPFIAIRHLVYMPLVGDIYSAIIYLAGIFIIGFSFSLACKAEDKGSHIYMYRPLMSLFSTLVLSWLIFYSAATIKKMIWSRE